MIVFIKLTARRYMVLDVSGRATGWQVAYGHSPKGFVSETPQIVLASGTQTEAAEAAGNYEAKHGRLLTAAEFEKQQEKAEKEEKSKPGKEK